ncbi:SNF2 family DNA-dependent ATPase [Crassisporium funariophilum]|nr:SNF2 family DNA-dependent ATPase [Crassisporium funariophilum]
MDSDVAKKTTSLLDALDASFMSPAHSTPGASQDTLLKGNLLQTPNTLDQYFQPDSSSSRRASAREALRNAQRTQVAEILDADNDADLLASSFDRSGTGGSGFRLRYDHDTPIRAIDVGGPDQQQKIADFVTKSIENTGNNLSVKEAMQKLGLSVQNDLLPGLEVRLLNHQVIGVAWMLEKERGPDRGGILADDMGLGKTVQMIATMAMNMAGLEDECRTTLIIVPAALLQQWKDEIVTKTNGIFEVHIHHGKDKLKKVSQVKSKDVVVTSYQTFCQDFPVPPKDEDEAEWLDEHGGMLSRVKFYRVVADEAQFIRNRATRSSISLAHVKSRYRWMLTGTPVTNTLADIYGLLRFGRFRPWNDWNDFNAHVAKIQSEDAPLAGSRAQAILKPILLRRTKDGELEGKPLLQLPPKEIKIIKLQFTPEERHIYDSFEKQSKIRLNKFFRESSVVKNHAVILVMILRLRQLCCHPHLILSQAEGFEDPTLLVGSDADKELGRAKKSMGAAWVADVKKRFLLRTAAAEYFDFDDENGEPEATCPNCKDMYINDSGRVLSCGHELCFDCSLDLSNSPIAHNGIFGQGSEKENLAVEKEYEAAAAKGYRPCPTCNKMTDFKSPDKVFKSSAFEPSAEELSNYARSKRRESANKHVFADVKMRSPSPTESIPEFLDDSDDDLPDIAHIHATPPSKRKHKKKPFEDEDDDTISESARKKRKMSESDSDLEIVETSFSQGKRRQSGTGKGPAESPNSKDKGKGREDATSNDGAPSEAIINTWKRGDDDLEPSTKMMAFIGFLKEWDSTGEKTICYSQWTSMLDLIETLFSRHGIRNLRFDGKMDRAERDATLAKFRQPGGPKVILISTKCGSVGLNLVSANRIVNMDLSWNYAAESQAYDRCHRIGQDKPVFVKRLVVEDTIEDRMLILQDVKVGLAEAALGEGTGGKLHKLSVKDIRYLFGMDKTNRPDNVRPPGNPS